VPTSVLVGVAQCTVSETFLREVTMLAWF